MTIYIVVRSDIRIVVDDNGAITTCKLETVVQQRLPRGIDDEGLLLVVDVTECTEACPVQLAPTAWTLATLHNSFTRHMNLAAFISPWWALHAAFQDTCTQSPIIL